MRHLLSKGLQVGYGAVRVTVQYSTVSVEQQQLFLF
jgi:hypothetical protein